MDGPISGVVPVPDYLADVGKVDVLDVALRSIVAGAALLALIVLAVHTLG